MTKIVFPLYFLAVAVLLCRISHNFGCQNLPLGERRPTKMVYVEENHTSYRRPSTMMMWYPKFVFTRVVVGLSTVDGVSWNAASWKAPTMLPRVIHPRFPPTIRRD